MDINTDLTSLKWDLIKSGGGGGGGFSPYPTFFFGGGGGLLCILFVIDAGTIYQTVSLLRQKTASDFFNNESWQLWKLH